MKDLTLLKLKEEAANFIAGVSSKTFEHLYGVNDGKAIGTHVEHYFHDYLEKSYVFERGCSASGIDFPSLNVDLKVTSIKQPQSSCPFRNAEQKVYGLGYNLLVLVYQKSDIHEIKAARMEFLNAIFVDKLHTADYQCTTGLLKILGNNPNEDDIAAFLQEKNLPLDEIQLGSLAERILKEPPAVGYLTISNALQWRLQYGRAIDLAQEDADGLEDLLR